MTSASKKDDFRMATLLRLREAARAERRLHLAEAHRADEELARRLTQLDTEQQRLQDECRQAAGPGEIDASRLAEAHRYIAGLHDRESELQEERESLTVEIDRRRELLVKADQDVQILEKLRDRRLRSRRLEEERQESKRLDEAAIQAIASGSTRLW
jgi:flagellar protein FliJ